MNEVCVCFCSLHPLLIVKYVLTALNVRQNVTIWQNFCINNRQKSLVVLLSPKRDVFFFSVKQLRWHMILIQSGLKLFWAMLHFWTHCWLDFWKCFVCLSIYYKETYDFMWVNRGQGFLLLSKMNIARMVELGALPGLQRRQSVKRCCILTNIFICNKIPFFSDMIIFGN